MIQTPANSAIPSVNALAESIKKEALRIGFTAVGIAPPRALTHRNRQLQEWLQNGFSGNLSYMEDFFSRHSRLLSNFQNLKSILVLAVSYDSHGDSSPAHSKGMGRIARYAVGRDYHKAIRKRLKEIESFILSQTGPDTRLLHTVDTSPVQERALAEGAGLGFIGKNTCLILPKGGSFVFLASILTNLELPVDEPIRWDCGACALCLEACPTQALKEPYQLDAGRCISFLTIENEGVIEPTLRPLMGEWIFGCDICQEVCPYNRKPLPTRWIEFKPDSGAGAQLPLAQILGIRKEETFLEQFAGTPLMRAKREGIIRNAAVVAGNLRERKLIPVLGKILKEESSLLVREHASWALKELSK